MADALLVTSSFLPGMGGIETYLAELATALDGRIVVMAPARRDGEPLPEDLPYGTIGHPGTMLVPTPAVARAIADRARRLEVDKILFGTPWPLALLGPALAARGLRYGVIAHGAELRVPAAIPVLRARTARALAGADILFAVSEYTKGRVDGLLRGRRLPVPRSEVLYSRVDVARFAPGPDRSGMREKWGLDEQSRVLLTLGRLVERKGVARMIDAMEIVNRHVPEAAYVIAGTGPLDGALRRRAARSDAHVVFAGRVPDERTADCYRAADLFVLPVADRWFGLEVEGLGVVLLEAAACGLPCVTGRSGGTPEAVADGRTGRVVDATDIEALARAVLELLSDDAAAGRMGRAGRAHVLTHFSGPLPVALTDWLSET